MHRLLMWTRRSPMSHTRRAASNWRRVGRELDAQGAGDDRPACSTPEQCQAWPRCTRATNLFRSRVVMSRHGFGHGEYRYLRYPLPPLIADVARGALPSRSRRSPIAGTRRWASPCASPTRHDGFLARCHDAGQTQPTPLLLQYERGRLQLPAPGSLRRACLPAAGGDAAVAARARLRPAASSC